MRIKIKRKEPKWKSEKVSFGLEGNMEWLKMFGGRP